MSRRARILACGALTTLGLAACGGGGSNAATVGACLDAAKQVVDCTSPSAQQKLVSDQSKPNAIACVQIGKPQVEVTVGGTKFCAERK